MVRKTPKITPRHRDPEVVQKAEEIFAGVKMTPDAAVAIFYKLTALRGDGLRAGKPLYAESLAAFNEPQESIAIYTIVDEMMADLWEVSQTTGQSFIAGGMETKAATPTSLDPKNPESEIAQKAEAVFAQMGMTSRRKPSPHSTSGRRCTTIASSAWPMEKSLTRKCRRRCASR